MTRGTDEIVDAASYDKEIEDEKQPSGVPPLNLVAMILKYGVDGHRFATPLEAKPFLRKEIERYEEMFYAALSAALSDMDDKGVPKSDHRRRWLYILPYVMSGNTWWTQYVSQYIYFADRC